MRDAYQRLSDEELLEVAAVQLLRPVAEIVSRPHVRVDCAGCGEEITNEREIHRGDVAYCRACAGDAYYREP
jgi:formylmethanofuran dehydrogenase subunit E